MSIQIKNKWNGSLMKTVNADNLSGADLRSANLSGADLSGADLSGANLSGADLSGANLNGADLNGADLRSADLRNVNLRNVNLRNVNLRNANLSGANLRSANLRSANLRSADLSGANLSGADLNGANLNGADLRSANLNGVDFSWYQFIPETGSFEAWKKCKNSVIVKLLIPASAKRSHGTERKCRATHAKVLHVYGAIEGISQHDSVTAYRKGETVKADSFDLDRWNTCGHGIHFFLTRKEAESS